MNKQTAFQDLLSQNWIQCQIIKRCVSGYQDKELIGIGHLGGDNYKNIICKSCAKTLGIKQREDIPKNGAILLDEYYKNN